MTLLAALLTLPTPLLQAPGAADFFPLVPGERRIYEVKTGGDKVTLIDEVGDKPAYFDGAAATPIIQKNQFNQVLSSQYYRIDGPTVLLVGSSEDRSAATANVGPDKTIDLTKRPDRRNVLLQLTPAMPVFRFEGGPTSWRYGEVPILRGAGGEEPIATDKTLIAGTSKLGLMKTVLGRKVETLEVKADVQMGEGSLAVHTVETSLYGRGIGLIESVRKETGGGRKSVETRMTLVGIEKR